MPIEVKVNYSVLDHLNVHPIFTPVRHILAVLAHTQKRPTFTCVSRLTMLLIQLDFVSPAPVPPPDTASWVVAIKWLHSGRGTMK